MRMKVFYLIIGVALLGLTGPRSSFGHEGKEKDSGYVKIEMKGKLRAYRMLLFGQTAATVTAGDLDVWLDYSKNEEVKKKSIVSFDGKTVIVKGKLEFRDFRATTESARNGGGEGPHPLLLRGQPVIVVESLQVAN